MATIPGVYLALFARPADPAGLAFFNGVTNNGTNLAGIGDLASQPEYITRFAGQSSEQIVQSIYQSLFGRLGETGGVQFFVAQLASGAQTINTIAINILDGAQGNDLAIVNNKLTASLNFTNALDTPAEQAAYSGTAAADIGRSYLSTITSDPSSIPSVTQTNAAILTLGGTVESFALTAGTDNLTGTGTTDEFTATDVTFLNSTDTVNGNDGNDRLTITTALATPSQVSPTLTSVESITVNGTGGLNLDLAKVTGLINFAYDTTGDLIIANAAAEQRYVFADKTDPNSTDATFIMQTGQSTLNLILNGTNSLDADLNSLNTGTASSVNISSNGPQGSILLGGSRLLSNDITSVQNANLSIFTLSGDASTSIGGGFSNSVILNGGTHRGDLYITGSTSDDQLNGGSGNNMFNGLDGFDLINLSQSTGQRDEVRLWDIKSFADRDVITGFQAGPGGDEIELRASNTTAPTNAASSPAFGTLGAPLNAPATLNLTTLDIIEFNFEITAGPLSTPQGAANFILTLTNNGAHAPSLAANATGYFLAYADGNAALFYVENDATPTFGSSAMELVGIITNVAVGSLDASNFDLV